MLHCRCRGEKKIVQGEAEDRCSRSVSVQEIEGTQAMVSKTISINPPYDDVRCQHLFMLIHESVNLKPSNLTHLFSCKDGGGGYRGGGIGCFSQISAKWRSSPLSKGSEHLTGTTENFWPHMFAQVLTRNQLSQTLISGQKLLEAIFARNRGIRGWELRTCGSSLHRCEMNTCHCTSLNRTRFTTDMGACSLWNIPYWPLQLKPQLISSNIDY